VLFLAVSVCSPVFDLDVPLGEAAAGSLAMVLLGIEFGWLALAVSAVTGRHVIANAVASAAAVAAYVLYAAGGLVTELEACQGFSPFDQALAGGPLGGGVPWAFLWMPTAAVVFVAAALPVFDRRDITAH
jgi:ABC-2 type transport system permease protein